MRIVLAVTGRTRLRRLREGNAGLMAGFALRRRMLAEKGVIRE